MPHLVQPTMLVAICLLTCVGIVASVSQTSATTSVASSAVTSLQKPTRGGNLTTRNFTRRVYPNDDDPIFTLETFVTIFVTLMIILTNCTIILVTAWTEAFSNFNTTFIYSLTLADLLIGIFITPYSIFLSIYRKWVFTR